MHCTFGPRLESSYKHEYGTVLTCSFVLGSTICGVYVVPEIQIRPIQHCYSPRAQRAGPELVLQKYYLLAFYRRRHLALQLQPRTHPENL